MPPTTLLASIAMLAAFAGHFAWAGEADPQRDRVRPRAGEAARGGSPAPGMRAVPNEAGPADRSHGWQYFTDPAAQRAVVISPQGDYYYSRGRGLRWVAAALDGSVP